MTEAPVPAVHFATSLKPYRSLSADGFRFVMLGAVAANLVIGLPLFLMGAWPVFGFMGLDVFLLWWLFQRSYFDARRSETLTLTDHDLVVVRIAPDGEREELRLDAYWLKVEATEERLVVTSRGMRHLTLLHSLTAFAFNMLVLALSINLMAGAIQLA